MVSAVGATELNSLLYCRLPADKVPSIGSTISRYSESKTIDSWAIQRAGLIGTAWEKMSPFERLTALSSIAHMASHPKNYIGGWADVVAIAEGTMAASSISPELRLRVSGQFAQAPMSATIHDFFDTWGATSGPFSPAQACFLSALAETPGALPSDVAIKMRSDKEVVELAKGWVVANTGFGLTASDTLKPTDTALAGLMVPSHGLTPPAGVEFIGMSGVVHGGGIGTHPFNSMDD
jgi:hypothetical protein